MACSFLSSFLPFWATWCIVAKTVLIIIIIIIYYYSSIIVIIIIITIIFSSLIMGNSYCLVRFSDRKIKEIVFSVYNTIALSQHGLKVIDKGYEPSVMPHYVSV